MSDDINAAADALLIEIAKAGGMTWDQTLGAYYLKGSVIPQKHLVQNLWRRGLIRSCEDGLLAETSQTFEAA